ncbi:hypothetical protein CYY_002979 [Polysphondylium violaceum]|uniref:TLDc domain-containing protein n=1 Tax=Polysphondylium violaceum TaxID=133409 RepID=A0A8J4UUP6_9MYCE|nr:hypothetical protein CYY_002979 [Polysphondylium violaceum]
MQIPSNYIDGIINDNARLQRENTELQREILKYKNAGCSNKDHISLLSEIENKDKKLEKRDRIINNRMGLIVTLYSGKIDQIDELKQEINKLLMERMDTLVEENNRLKSDLDKKNQIMNENLQSLYCSLLEEHSKLKSKLETITSFDEELKSLKSKNKKMKKKKESLETKYALLISNHDEKEKEIQEIKEKLSVYEKAESKTPFKNIVLESKIIDYISFKTINDWIDNSKNYSFKIIYRASNNRFSTQSFHSACDGKGSTITLIEATDGCVFGGYNSQFWNSNGKWYGDNKCFIFTLVNKHGIKPTKYLPDPTKKCYVYCGSSTGPSFGFEDINILGQKGNQSFPCTYIDTTGKGISTLTPSKEFIIKDYEVYQCLED